MDTVLRSRSRTVTIGAEQPFCIIGERINPTGRKMFAEELRGGDLSTVTADARRAGRRRAPTCSTSTPGSRSSTSRAAEVDAAAPCRTAVDVPICIDSSVIEALEAGLSVYEGRALVNSVTAEDERLERDPAAGRAPRRGRDRTRQRRDRDPRDARRSACECARKIVAAADDHGIATEDVIIDPLAMTVGADTEAVTTTLATISLIRDELGRQHVPGRVERLVRPAPAPRPQRGRSCRWRWPPA